MFIYNYKKELGMSEIKKKTSGKKWWLLLIAAIGPGLTVMLADTDAGSLITAAQSGARWGYHLLGLQLVIIPILYFIQELTTRIGITTGKGHAALIRDVFGIKWAWISVTALFVASIGALVTEFAGIVGVGLIFGVSKWITVPLSVVGLIAVSMTGKYKRVESISIIVGMFEIVFIPAAIFAKPSLSEIAGAFILNQPFGDHSYWVLIAANVGAIIMPWMLFYQQGAVVDKGLSNDSIKYSRIDTFMGAIVTQVIMSAVLILTAATIGKTNPNAPLSSVQEIAGVLTPLLGPFIGKILFAIGLTGAALIAAIVVSLAISWSLGEILKVTCTLNCKWDEAPVFYGIYAGGIIAAAILVLLGIPLVTLTIAIEVMNCLLLPIVLGFLLVLAWKIIPIPYKLKLLEKIILVIIYTLICALGIYTVFQLFF